jgi:hypothetical protein
LNPALVEYAVPRAPLELDQHEVLFGGRPDDEIGTKRALYVELALISIGMALAGCELDQQAQVHLGLQLVDYAGLGELRVAVQPLLVFVQFLFRRGIVQNDLRKNASRHVLEILPAASPSKR